MTSPYPNPRAMVDRVIRGESVFGDPGYVKPLPIASNAVVRAEAAHYLLGAVFRRPVEAVATTQLVHRVLVYLMESGRDRADPLVLQLAVDRYAESGRYIEQSLAAFIAENTWELVEATAVLAMRLDPAHSLFTATTPREFPPPTIVWESGQWQLGLIQHRPHLEKVIAFYAREAMSASAASQLYHLTRLGAPFGCVLYVGGVIEKVLWWNTPMDHDKVLLAWTVATARAPERDEDAVVARYLELLRAMRS